MHDTPKPRTLEWNLYISLLLHCYQRDRKNQIDRHNLRYTLALPLLLLGSRPMYPEAAFL